MKSYFDWINEETKDQEKNAQGGFEPKTSTQTQIFKKADLITLPPSVQGTNCFNCEYAENKQGDTAYCRNEAVKQMVTKRMCCSYWNNHGVKRAWDKDEK